MCQECTKGVTLCAGLRRVSDFLTVEQVRIVDRPLHLADACLLCAAGVRIALDVIRELAEFCGIADRLPSERAGVVDLLAGCPLFVVFRWCLSGGFVFGELSPQIPLTALAKQREFHRIKSGIHTIAQDLRRVGRRVERRTKG